MARLIYMWNRFIDGTLLGFGVGVAYKAMQELGWF